MNVVGFLQSRFQYNPTVDLTVVGDAIYKNYVQTLVGEDMPALIPGEPITGFFEITNTTGKAIAHKGLQVSVVGHTKLKDGTIVEQFLCESKLLQEPGEIGVDDKITDAFEFTTIDFPACSYRGYKIDVEYAIEFRVLHSVLDFVVTKPFLIFFFDDPVEPVPYHNEIGIRDELTLAFDFGRTVYDCLSSVRGQVHFQHSRIQMRKIELELFCWEKCNSEAFECENLKVMKRRTIAKKLKVDDHIPFKFHLSGCNIWPYAGRPSDPLRVKYFLQVGLTDNTGKHYHKKFPLLFQRFTVLP